MLRNVTMLLVTTVFVCFAANGGVSKKDIGKAVVQEENGPMGVPLVPPPPAPDFSVLPSMVGTYTTLSGYNDWQSNGGGVQYIRVNPANGNIHVTFMVDADSPQVTGQPNRATVYAMSTNGGVSWNNFNNITIPPRRSGFPTLDLGQGAIAGSPLLGNHSVFGSGNLGSLYIDSPEGSGIFTEIGQPSPSPPGGAPIWPYVAGALDGSVVMVCSPNVTGEFPYYTRTADYSTWSAWTQYAAAGIGGRYPVHANGSGRVGILQNGTSTGVFFLESTNNGTTWPSTPTQIHPPQRITPTDTFQVYVGADFIYQGNNVLAVMHELNVGASDPTDGSQIVFWSTATQFVVAATRANTPGVVTELALPQVNKRTMGYPVVGLSGSTIVVIYVGTMAPTSAAGYNFADLFMVRSGDGGATWTAPVNITNTPDLDEQWPAISPWNAPGEVNIVWQEDPQPGTSISGTINDPNSPWARTYLKFHRLILTDVGEGETRATAFRLSQNYPNPFNPSTTIDYSVPKGTHVRLVVYNALGQEVATLVDGYRNAGSYAAEFSAANVASGVYFYTLTAGEFSSTRKMVLMR